MSKFLKKILPNKDDQIDVRYFKISIFALVGFSAFMVTVGLLTFFLFLQAPEETMVPDLIGMELENALVNLQERELYPNVQLRFSSDPSTKGQIIEQDPPSGTLATAGRQINIVVSKGAVVDRVENYVGQDLNELRVYLQTLFTTYRPLLTIQEPVTYVYNEAPPGTILEQSPEPGTELTDLTEMELIVSRGPQGEAINVPHFVGRNFQDVLNTVTRQQIPFYFNRRPPEENEEPGTVISQDPVGGTEIERGQTVSLTMVDPENIPEGRVFTIFQANLPNYALYVEMRLEAEDQDGEVTTILETRHPGGTISIPCIVEENTVLRLFIYDQEVRSDFATPLVVGEETLEESQEE
ncbi:MAG: PASTA domain-containing protein [Spirochaetia bacterium]